MTTQPHDEDKADYAGLNPLSNDKPLEDDGGPEASTVDSGGGPNQTDEPDDEQARQP